MKKEWVERQKLRSKWKAQKRKEGLGSASAVTLDRLRLDVEEAEKDADNVLNASDGESSGSSESEPANDSQVPTPKKQRSDVDKYGKQPAGEKRQPASSLRTKGNAEEKADSKDLKTSVREFTRKAYSREMLHTHKSDSLHRRKETGPRKNAVAEKAGRERGGRGQPNMKLRMEVMLERIKRDFT